MNIDIKNNSSPALRRAIMANALFSGLSGLLIVAFEPAVLSWLGLGSVSISAVGVMLIGFALYLAWMANSRRVPVATIRAVIFSDWAWVAASIVLVGLKAAIFSGFGIFLILDIAVVVMVFALLQGRALKQALNQ
jgi:hypothetical protein